MLRRPLMLLLLSMFAIAGSVHAEVPAIPADGTMFLGGKNYKLTHFAVYDATVDDNELTAVMASERPISLAKVKAALKENEDDNDRILESPHVVVFFNKEGEIQNANLWADGTTSFTSRGLTGELKKDGSRASGKVLMETNGEGAFVQNFAFKFDVPFGLDAGEKPKAKPTGPVKMTVNGKFIGDGKPAKLAFVSVQRIEPFADKPSLRLIFTEKDHSKDKKADFSAGFGNFGSALIISLHDEGQIFGCEVAHSAHKQKPFSSVGSIKSEDFEVGDGQVKGKIVTDGEADAFGQKWEVDLDFTVPFVETKSAKSVASDKPSKKAVMKRDADEEDGDDEEDEDKKKKSAGPAIKVLDLPLPKDATDIERKQLVEQITCKSPSSISSIAADLSKRLKEQGWKSGTGDLVTPKSAILKLERGEAELTIMVSPEGKGSKLMIFTEGLDWTKPEKDE